MSTISYPTDYALRLVAQNKLPALTMTDPIFDLFPITTSLDDRLVWEQMDNFLGLQAVRGLDGDPPRVKKTGAKSYDMDPGVYGEFELISEKELTRRRPYGAYSGQIPIDDLVMTAQDKLMNREVDRVKYLGWTVVVSGTISVASVDNAVLHTATFSPATYSGSAWGTPASGTPLADFRAAQLLFRGTSAIGGPMAKAYMNQVTFNKMISNTNAADIYGRRVSGLATANGLRGINAVLLEDGLPEIVIYDGGYINDSGTFTLFIPDNKTVIVGARPNGAPVGEYRMTRNMNNPDGAGGSYSFINDTVGKKAPRRIEVHQGHNGGPVLYFPSSIIVMTTT